MKYFLLVLLIMLAFNGFCQNYLMLEDGSNLRYKKMDQEQSSVKIILYETGKKQEFPIQQVKGYYSTSEEAVFFKKPSLASNEFAQTYKFIEKTLHGKINLYEFRISGNSAGNPVGISGAPIGGGMASRVMPGTPMETLGFMEKEGRYEEMVRVSNVLGIGKAKKLEQLKSFLQDNPQIINRLDEDFKLEDGNIRDLLKEYNIMAFQPDFKGNSSQKGSITIYRKDNAKAESIQLRVNDSLVVLEANDFVTLQAPAEGLSKVCLGSDSKGCELIQPYSFFETHYEVVFNPRTKVYGLERRLKKEADYYKNLIAYRKKKKK